MEQGINDEGGMCKSEEAINIYTHLLYRQAALRAWEALYQDGPQVSLPQASAVHLRGQTADLSWRALTGFVGQLEEREKRTVCKHEHGTFHMFVVQRFTSFLMGLKDHSVPPVFILHLLFSI